MSNSEDDTMMIPPARKKVKLNNTELIVDMLSDLPDCVILRILSLLNTKDAVRTCILSVRWKDLWKHLPVLTFHRSHFSTIKILNKFVSKVLSLRDSSISLHTLDYNHGTGRLEPHILRRIVNYAISHNVQRLGLCVTSSFAQIPLTLFSSHTLTHLKLFISDRDFAQFSLNLPSLTCLQLSVYSGHENLFPKSLYLPALTSLQLEHFTFCIGDNDCAEPFSIFDRLNSLLVSDCTVKGTTTLCISSTTLVNFTMYSDSEDNYYKIDLCTPSLSTFTFCGTPYHKISGSNISSLKHVDIHAEVVPCDHRLPPLFLFMWLLEFADVISLTVTATTLQVLNLILDLFKYNFPSLGKLKLLKVEVDEIHIEFRLTLCGIKLRNIKSKKEAAKIRKAFELGLEPSPAVPDGIVDFLLQNSPSAEVVFVDCTKKPLRPRHL